MKGFNNVRYFFGSWEDAEIYLYYLYQLDGVDFIKRVLSSKKMPNWEKKEYKAFLETLDLKTLKDIASTIQFSSEKSFVAHIKRQTDGETDYSNDDCEELS